MSWGLKASILIALDAYDGHWVPLHAIAKRVMVDAAQVEAACAGMAEEGLLQSGLVDGVTAFGVHVDARSPLCTMEAQP